MKVGVTGDRVWERILYFLMILVRSVSFLVLCLGLTLQGCGKKSGSTESGTKSGGDLEEPPSDPPPSDALFYVHNEPVSGMYRLIHKDGDWNTKCYVDFSETNAAKRLVNCVVESMELDLHHMGLELSYNIPVFKKCSYVLQKSSYFLSAPVRESDGKNHTPLEVSYTLNSDGSILTNSYVVKTADGDVFNSGTTPTGLTVAPLNGTEPTCKYDYRTLVGGQNCCSGSYTVNQITASGTITSIKSWGGDPGLCIDGPARIADYVGKDRTVYPIMWRRINQPDVGFFNFETKVKSTLLGLVKGEHLKKVSPKPSFQLMSQDEVKKFLKWQEFKSFGWIPKGVREPDFIGPSSELPQSLGIADTPTSPSKSTPEYSFGKWKVGPKTTSEGSATEVLFHNNFFLANWLDSTQTDTATLPRPFKDIKQNIGHHNFGSDSRANSWICYDDAKEMYAGINVYVREWNLYSKLKAAKSDPVAGLTGDDDTTGTEDDFVTEPKNDFLDWEDYNSFPGFRDWGGG